MTRRSMILFLTAGLTATAASACNTKEQAPPPSDEAVEHPGEHEEENTIQLTARMAERIQLDVAPVEVRPLSGMFTTTGRVDFNQDRMAQVSPRVQGRVHRVFVTLGDTVKQGQTLAIIDSIELGRAKSAFVQAKVQLDLARSTRAREEKLFKDRITSEQAVLEARSAEQQARAAYQAARQELHLLGLSEQEIDKISANDPSAALFPITSPLDGTVVEKHATQGEVVSPDNDMFTIADLSQVWIWIDLYERDLARVHPDDQVSVRVDAYPDLTFEGKVSYIQSQVDPDTRRIRARIEVTDDRLRLRPGMFAKVTVTDPHGVDGKNAPKVVVAPAGAIQRDGSRYVVFVPVGKNRYERREVTLGRRTDAYVEVLDGLFPGDLVVVKGTFYLKSEAAKDTISGEHLD